MFPRSESEAADAHLILELCLGDRAPFGLIDFFTGALEGEHEGHTPARHSTTEVLDGARADTATVTLALKEDRKANKPEPVKRPVRFDTAVTALPVTTTSGSKSASPSSRLASRSKASGAMLMSYSSS